MIHKLYLTKKARTKLDLAPGQRVKLAHGPANAVIECEVRKPLADTVRTLNARAVAVLHVMDVDPAAPPLEITHPYLTAIRAAIMPTETPCGEDIDLSAFGM